MNDITDNSNFYAVWVWIKSFLYLADGDDDDEQQEQQNDVPQPPVAPKKRKAQVSEFPHTAVKPVGQDFNLSEKLLQESASERDRISEVCLRDGLSLTVVPV